MDKYQGKLGSLVFSLGEGKLWIRTRKNVKLATLVESVSKAPFSKASRPRCGRGRYSIPWIALFYPWFQPYNA